MTEHYEVDIQLLEDMLADVEEYAFLVNSEYNVVWINKPLAVRLGQEMAKDNTKLNIDNSLLKDLCVNVLGNDYIKDLEAVKKTFSTGRVAKHMHTYKGSTFKTFCMPIKGRESTLYVLVIVEDLGNQEKENQALNILTLLLDNEKSPAFMTDEHGNVIAKNRAIENAFSKSKTLMDLLLQQPKKSNHNSVIKDMNNLIGFKYKILLKTLRKHKSVQAYTYVLKKK